MKHIRPLKNFVLKESSISALFLMVFCWTLFDGMLQYITPLLMADHGFSNTVIGLLIGCSSIGGAIFDLVICKIFKNTDYRRMFLAMLAICTIYPLVLGNASSVIVFLLAMMLWGFYFDLYGFGVFDYIGRYTVKKEHTSSFGCIQVSRSLGIIIAPIIIGFVVAGVLFYRAFIIAWIFIIMATIFYLVLLFLNRNKRPLTETEMPKHKRKTNFIEEFQLWKKIGNKISLPLLITFYLFFIEAFFFTLAPLYADNLEQIKFGGFFLAAYSLPVLLSGLVVGKIVSKFGKIKTARFCLLIGSTIISTFMLVHNPYISIIIVIAASFFFGISFPSINGIYADLISETPLLEGEIETWEDFSFNIGYILGPITAGFLSDIFSIPAAFSILGIVGIIISVALIISKQFRICIR